jgi:DNA-binding CsgD family transcriptional regulator
MAMTDSQASKTGKESEGSVYDFLQARALPALYVLDEAYRVLSYWAPADVEQSFVPLRRAPDQALRLNVEVETAVREATVAWATALPKNGAALAIVAPAAAVRIMPLIGAAGFAVTIERIKTRNAVEGARRRFSLSPREIDVLSLVLEGCDTPAVAVRLHIARSTANDHVKRMLAKTASRNRAELVARVLGWTK